ncbi:hypothetical protein BCF44_106517 [Kutzneria buriramensis]|uniref:Uncharacterized protein n=1 Tax=Kutzneria buriramensis TaxID=1045776 RepID=A0A3E0HLI3_9PSEU|nr:hypothetical protein BCF44_106517 [Kutzneria buriramensis]
MVSVATSPKLGPSPTVISFYTRLDVISVAAADLIDPNGAARWFLCTLGRNFGCHGLSHSDIGRRLGFYTPSNVTPIASSTTSRPTTQATTFLYILKRDPGCHLCLPCSHNRPIEVSIRPQTCPRLPPTSGMSLGSAPTCFCKPLGVTSVATAPWAPGRSSGRRGFCTPLRVTSVATTVPTTPTVPGGRFCTPLGATLVAICVDSPLTTVIIAVYIRPGRGFGCRLGAISSRLAHTRFRTPLGVASVAPCLNRNDSPRGHLWREKLSAQAATRDERASEPLGVSPYAQGSKPPSDMTRYGRSETGCGGPAQRSCVACWD